MKITTTTGKDDNAKSLTLDYDFGENTAAFVKAFTEEVGFSYIINAAVLKFQAKVRTALNGGKTKEEIAKEMLAWKPGLKREKKSEVDKALTAIGNMSETEKDAMRAQLAELLKKK